MRYDEFRDRWQVALRSARLLAHHDRPEESIDLTTTERRWRLRLLPRPVEPFHAGATISFRWSPLDSARSYTCEEDLLTELFGRRAGARCAWTSCSARPSPMGRRHPSVRPMSGCPGSPPWSKSSTTRSRRGIGGR